MRLARLTVGALLVLCVIMVAFAGLASSMNSIRSPSSAVDSNMPSFENRCETDHFVLWWTNRSMASGDNISDPQIINETGEYLEKAWGEYTELFGRRPHTAPGRDKIDVVFWDIDGYGVSDPPDGPIQFSSYIWVHNKTVRKPTSAHELFHKLQYAYGYKTKWQPRKPYQWFTEGTAAWSEAFVWGRVSNQNKVDALFKNTDMDLYEADYRAMPFWIYFVQGNHEHPNNQLMVKLFEKCEELRDERRALSQVINETYGSVDSFFRAFAKERRNGFWSEACADPYKCILGPDGRDIVAEVKNFQRQWNGN